MNFKNNLLSFTIIPLLALTVASSYYHFVVLNDYLVLYEGECIPETESCFYDCEDEDCTSYYYFTKIERHAAEIRSLCGENVLKCEEAYFCPDDVEHCVISYCDAEVDGDACETINSNSL